MLRTLPPEFGFLSAPPGKPTRKRGLAVHAHLANKAVAVSRLRLGRGDSFASVAIGSRESVARLLAAAAPDALRNVDQYALSLPFSFSRSLALTAGTSRSVQKELLDQFLSQLGLEARQNVGCGAPPS